MCLRDPENGIRVTGPRRQDSYDTHEPRVFRAVPLSSSTILRDARRTRRPSAAQDRES